MHNPDLHRRRLLLGLALSPALLQSRLSFAAAAVADASTPSGAARERFLARVAQLETQGGGRLGVCALGWPGAAPIAHRGDERFLFCSTFKVLAVALVLQRVDAGDERLDRAIPVRKADLVSYSPITEAAAGKSMTIEALCAAAITVSDNTAANLLFASFGGPAALTAFLRHLGDAVTRSDRIETALNLRGAPPEQDTTSPVALARTLRLLLGSRLLSNASRTRLRDWMQGSTTGSARIRAGLPSGWAAGDKTGTGATSTNDVAWIQPPQGPLLTLAVYYADATGDIAAQNAVIADVGRAFAAVVAARA